MIKIIRPLLLLMLACLLQPIAKANPYPRITPEEARDSVVVVFGDNTRLIIYGDNRKDLQKLLKYDLNALIRDLGGRLDAIQAGGDSTFTEELDGRAYLKDSAKTSADESFVRISMKGIRIKDGDSELVISPKGMRIKDGKEQVRIGRPDDENEDDSTDTDDDGSVRKIQRVKRVKSPRSGFNMQLGLNAYSTNDPMGYPIADYDLRPFGSRFISLGVVRSARLAQGKNSSLHMDFGADFSWHNLMFDGNTTVAAATNRVSFPEVLNTEGRPVDLSKSKLVVPHVNLSLMPTLRFSKTLITHVSAGVYGGYRLGGYTKTKLAATGEKDHIRQNYYLNTFRGGLAAEVGIKNFVDLFVNYDLTPVFQSGQGSGEIKAPSVRMVSFGIRL
jgi:hypothetical protein